MARVDTLGNFLTDVADAIREKKGTSSLISPSDFDTEIGSISGGSSPTSVTELNEIIVNAMDEFQNYMETFSNTFNTYTNDPVTLHTPNIDYKYYAIQKRSSGNYRVFWTNAPGVFINNNGIYNVGWYLNTVYDSNLPKINASYPSFQPHEANMTKQTFYVSSEYSSIETCLQMMLNNTLSYSYINNFLGYIPDTPYAIPYTNLYVIDGRNSSTTYDLAISQRISKKETIN